MNPLRFTQTLGIILTLFLNTSALAEKQPSLEEWKLMADQWKLTLVLSEANPSSRNGTKLKMVLTNVSTTKQWLLHQPLLILDYGVSVADKDGKVVGLTAEGKQIWEAATPGRFIFEGLEPNAADTKEVNLSKLFQLQKGEKYTVTVRRCKSMFNREFGETMASSEFVDK